MTEQGILVEGVVYVQVLYIAADDKVPVNAVKGMIPFSHIVEVPGIHKKCTFEIIPSLGGVSSAMADSEEIEVRAELLLNTMVFERTEIPVIAALTEKPLDMEALDRMPGMTGYIVQAGDTMWDVAKRFSTTTAEIMEANQLDSDSLKKGQKLLIVRELVTS